MRQIKGEVSAVRPKLGAQLNQSRHETLRIWLTEGVENIYELGRDP
jgi:hypothetical protein